MTKLPLVLALFISILFTTSAIAQVSTDQARHFQVNPTHTGAITLPGLTPPLRQKWSINFGDYISYPIIADGRVFVTVKHSGPLYDSQVYAINAANGAILWSYNLTGESLWSALTYENGRLFASTHEGGLRCFDAATGTVLWTISVGGPYMAPPTAFQGVVYLSGRGYVWAFSQATGNFLWRTPAYNSDTSSPVVTDEAIYVSYSCPDVYKLNRTTGAEIWSYHGGCSSAGGKTAVLHNGRLYVRDGIIDYIFDSQTGSILDTVSSPLWENLPAFSGNMGFFLHGAPRFAQLATLEGRDLSNNNALVWSFTGDGYLQSGLLVVNNIVYVGSDRGKLYGLDAATGQVVWSTTAGASIPYIDEHNGGRPTAGLAAGEGLLVIPTSTTLIAYEADNSPLGVNWNATVPAANASGWNNTAVDLPFTPSGANFATPESPLHFTAEGANQTQDVTVTGRGGIVMTVTSPVINIDMTAPATSANITGNGSEWSTSVQVTLNSSDNLSGVANTFYKLDGGAAQTYTSQFSIPNGTHTLSYWSVDVAGNTESTHSGTFKVDNAAPTTQLSTSGAAGANGWFMSAVQVSLNASDNTSGVASTFYRVDGGAAQTYTGSFSIGNEGLHQLTFWSVDVAGNTEAQQSIAVKIDWTWPTVLHSLSGVMGSYGFGYYTTPVQVTLNASDNLSGIANVYYRIDGSATNNYTGTFTVSTDGIHQLEFWCMDVAGNSSNNISTVFFKIDRTPPVTQASFSTNNLGNNGWYRGTVQISMSATDNLSGVEKTQYTIDNGTLKIYSAPFNYSTNGIHALNYWSNDKVPNYEQSHFVQLKIDQQAPSVSINATPASAVVSSTPVTVTVSGRITDALSGIDPASVFYNVIDEYSVISLSGPVTLQTNGDYSFTLSLPATKNAGDRQHVYTIYISAADMAGISKSVNDTVKIN